VLHTCSRSTILLAKGGVNCHTCWSERPSMSNMSTAPATCVSGSSMAISRKSTQPLYTSSRETLLCFHFSAHTHTTMILLAPLHTFLWLLVGETCPAGGHGILAGRKQGRERSTLNQIVQFHVSMTHLFSFFCIFKIMCNIQSIQNKVVYYSSIIHENCMFQKLKGHNTQETQTHTHTHTHMHTVVSL